MDDGGSGRRGPTVDHGGEWTTGAHCGPRWSDHTTTWGCTYYRRKILFEIIIKRRKFYRVFVRGYFCQTDFRGVKKQIVGKTLTAQRGVRCSKTSPTKYSNRSFYPIGPMRSMRRGRSANNVSTIHSAYEITTNFHDLTQIFLRVVVRPRILDRDDKDYCQQLLLLYMYVIRPGGG